ncbi:hypothetical protein STEG23_020641 [Scotinomys teguina]
MVRSEMQLAYPVFQDPQGQRYHEPLDFKVIKSLAESCLEYDMITVILQQTINNSIFKYALPTASDLDGNPSNGENSLSIPTFLTESSCSWRIKHNEEDDGDLRNDCLFFLFLRPEPIEDDFYNTMIDFSVWFYDDILIHLDLGFLKGDKYRLICNLLHTDMELD